jgi:oxalate decarboxylase/phosphoglucose isomerase-like protein (cupin superfamily)
VWLFDGEGAGEEYNLASSGTYASLRSGRTLHWDGPTQLYLAHRGDGSVLVFDSGGVLRRLRGSDGGEAQLRYAGEVANPARAVKLRFTDASMVGCTVTIRQASTWLGRYTNIALDD